MGSCRAMGSCQDMGSFQVVAPSNHRSLILTGLFRPTRLSSHEPFELRILSSYGNTPPPPPPPPPPPGPALGLSNHGFFKRKDPSRTNYESFFRPCVYRSLISHGSFRPHESFQTHASFGLWLCSDRGSFKTMDLSSPSGLFRPAGLSIHLVCRPIGLSSYGSFTQLGPSKYASLEPSLCRIIRFFSRLGPFRPSVFHAVGLSRRRPDGRAMSRSDYESDRTTDDEPLVFKADQFTQN